MALIAWTQDGKKDRRCRIENVWQENRFSLRAETMHLTLNDLSLLRYESPEVKGRDDGEGKEEAAVG